MSSYLATWYDPALEPGQDLTAKAMREEEIVRLTKLLSVAQAAGTIARRLGADATDEELAIDKKRCRRIAHVAQKVLVSWGVEKPKTTDAIREAAIVDWQRWWSEHRVWLDNRRRLVATWAQKSGVAADQKFAKSTVVKLTNEASWIEYALRD